MKEKLQYKGSEILTLNELDMLLKALKRPVILVEGVRALPGPDRAVVVKMGRLLGMRYPLATFRTGNAEGTDTAFAEGVASVDPARLEYILPHPGMGRTRRHPQGQTVSLAPLPKVTEDRMAEYTVETTPDYAGLVRGYLSGHRDGPQAAKVRYLLRDTLKVIGAPEIGLAPASAGVFYVNSSEPLAGGTGHTIRACLRMNIPIVSQAVWRRWVDEKEVRS